VDLKNAKKHKFDDENMSYSTFGIESGINMIIVPRFNETDLLVRLENLHDTFDGA
jgi:hypothetical protein